MSNLRMRMPLGALACLALLSCATVPPSERSRHDPWQRMNRATFRFNEQFDRVIAKPAAKAYLRDVPLMIRVGINNFLHNLEYPTVIVNDLLQGQFTPMVRDTSRLVINTTVGVGGLLDPAARMGLARDDRDFGQTFGKWGIGPGPYLVLPFLGPSDLRDAIGLVPAEYTDPLHYVQNGWADYGTRTVDSVNVRANLLPTTRLIEQAYDPYSFARNAYLSRREFLVKGAKKEGGAEDELKELESGGGN